MTATRKHSIYLSFELGLNDWKLAFSTSIGTPARQRSIGGGKLERLLTEIAQAKKRFGLPADAPVRSCYEAGRDGFWLHRWLCEHGIENIIVDSASIEVNRRYRRRKTDRLDAAKLVTMLIRHHAGERLWSVVRVPSPEDEDRRHLHRDLEEMKAERTAHINRIKGLLHGVGIRRVEISAKFAALLPTLQTPNGEALPTALCQRLLRELARLQYVAQQIGALERQRERAACTGDGQRHVEQTRKLMQVRGVGLHGAWVCVLELFGWRQVKNRRELASLVGLTPTPYDTGESEREQGISKAGNRRLRMLLVQLAWSWLHYQNKSALSRWYRKRFGCGGARQRKIGIVALARKLLIALWKYLERDEVPEGALLVDWKEKLSGRCVPLKREAMPV